MEQPLAPFVYPDFTQESGFNGVKAMRSSSTFQGPLRVCRPPCAVDVHACIVMRRRSMRTRPPSAITMSTVAVANAAP